MTIELKNYILLSTLEHQQLLQIRNSKIVRENSKNLDLINNKDHQEWMEKLKNDSTKIYYAVIVDSVIVGGINAVDIHSKEIPSWGIFFTCTIQPLISSLVTYVFLDRIFNTLNVNILNSEVNILNTNAYRFSTSFGLTVYEKSIDNGKEYYMMSISKKTWNENKASSFAKMIKKRINAVEIAFNN